MRILLTALVAALVIPTTAMAAQRYDYCGMFDGRVVLFAIDRTDAYDGLDKEILSAGAEKILAGLKPGDRLIIHTISDDPSLSRKLFDQCLPGCPSENLLSSILGTCREAVVRRDFVDFREQYALALLPLMQSEEEHKGSAIIATLSALTKQYEAGGVDELVVFSDLVENSQIGNFSKLSATDVASVIAHVTKLGMDAALKDASVIDFGFGRAQGENRKGLSPEITAHIESFWKAYLNEAGASSITISQRYE